uniref:Cytochrome P450 monooxygenase AKT7 ) n=1 Tax=Ganoderma boninense TaxID=34458 RepID=A0A5K1K6K1_9APHY|nr:Cytochrome P450 monooxygenase AKT7 (EC (AK-toxin biosynthesis protein 7) [Ganoderma boninense]
MPFYPFSTAIKSTVIGGSWSTPCGTRFFVRWGNVSLKVPMAALRDEYEAWEKLRRERHPEPEPEPEPPKPALLPSLLSGPFDWADNVEQEFFSSSNESDSEDDSTNDTPLNPISLPSFPSDHFDWADDLDTDVVDSPIVDQVLADWISAVGTGTTLCAIRELYKEEDVPWEDEADDFDWIDLFNADSTDSTDPDTTIMPDNDTTILADGDKTILADSDWTSLDDSDSAPSTISTDTATTVYRIVNIDTTGPDFSLHMVEYDTASDASNTKADDPAATAKELSDTMQLLSTADLLNLDTYATVFDTAARACVAGPPFWLVDPLGEREIVLA